MSQAYGLVLLLVVLTYVLASLIRPSGVGAVALTAAGGSAGAVALGSSEVRPPLVRLAVGVVVLAAVLAAIGAVSGDDGFYAAAGLIQMLLLVAATVAVLKSVLSELAVNFRTILGAISVYMIFGLIFTSLYLALDRLESAPFFEHGGGGTGDFVFFSFTTLTTTGYGDLVPARQPGMMFAGLEMLLGQIFLVTLIAGLVSLWRPRQRG
ncbi:MAG TPA: ion channel [Solirubrobacterales bacterium]|jgi:hypothetical protein